MTLQGKINVLQKLVLAAFWLLFSLLGFWHFYVIWRTAVDVPILDEWFLFEKDGLILGWSSKFLFAFQNEHRLLITRIFYWLNYQIFDLNFKYQIIFDVFLFAAMVAMSYWLIVRKNGLQGNLAALLGLGVFAANLPYEIHSWAVLSNMAVVMMALLVGTYLLFYSKKSLVLGLACLLFFLAIYSFAGAMSAVVVILFFYVAASILEWRPRRVIQSLVVAAAMALAIGLWFLGYQKNPGHPPYQMPWSAAFWDYFIELTSLGFGYTQPNRWISWLCLFLVVLSLGAALYRSRRFKQDSSAVLFLSVFCLGILAMMASISLGRAGFGVFQAKSSRYSLLPMFLPMLSVAFFSFVPKLRILGSTVIGLVVVFGIWDNFSMEQYYKIRSDRLQGRYCLKKLYFRPETNPAGVCTKITIPVDLKEPLERAGKLGVNFIQPWQDSLR